MSRRNSAADRSFVGLRAVDRRSTSSLSTAQKGLQDRPGGFFISLFTSITRRIMDLWFETEIRMRRDDAFKSAERSRLIRLAESGRSTSVRTRIADGAQAMSDALAALAQTLREQT